MRRRYLVLVCLAIALAAALAYLRDPPWLIQMESGFRGWETGSDGVRYRWTGGHASFFVPSEAARLTVPVRTTFVAPDDPPVTVSAFVDDRPAASVLLSDGRWVDLLIPLPRGGTRRVRRIDLRVDHVRPGNRGVEAGAITTR